MIGNIKMLNSYVRGLKVYDPQIPFDKVMALLYHTSYFTIDFPVAIAMCLGVIVDDLINKGKSDNGTSLTAKEYTRVVADKLAMTIFVISLFDETRIIGIITEYIQPICGPTQFIGEIDDGDDPYTLGLNIVGKAFQESSLSWKRKGDGVVTIVFKSIDTKPVTVNIFSGGDKIDEKDVPAGEMVDDTSYNTSVLADLELVVVVVDCSFTALVTGDPSVERIFNLVRSRDDPSDLYLVTVSLSVQDYEIPDQNKNGPALLGMLSVINDMSTGSVEQFYMVAPTYPFQRSLEFVIYDFVGLTNDSHLELRSIPPDPLSQPVSNLVTSRNRGLVQSNTHSMYSLLDTADTEYVDALGLTIFSLIILSLVTYQNIRVGKIWIGAPFASVSTATLVSRGFLVVVSWYVNSFWTLYEFALSNAAKLSGNEVVHVHKELVHADVLVVYLGIVAFLSWVIRERIDPAIAIFLFEIIHKHRLSFIKMSPPILNKIVTYSDSVFRLGITKVSSDVNDMSPLDFWSTFQIPNKDGIFLAASFFPKISLLGLIVCYAMLRKIYRYFYPEPIHLRSSQSRNQSANEKAALTLKGTLTNFEISTGAELQTRFGVISDYKNYVYFKGMKFASADGVYCSGYVIVNGKSLVKSKDLLAIVMIKLVHSRFTNVYVYEVEGNTVKETARLVYPMTFAWSDLWRLNVTVLL
ncbi:hypothetical protein JG688_00014805 [Phytophthora aleatoria]|uniref:Uncharacterized protein n=1 Tax=Phytophthora aleatoria TaxID=2496075 RepID=A0A8J5IBC3_9STRA|nr:hypothetical protein JG688_00014805 [Phytophthora aleatoria]